MAHQTHNIPWNVLASNLTWVAVNHCQEYDVAGHYRTKVKGNNLHLRYQPNQGKELTYFVRAFAKTLSEHSTCERLKYPEKYEPPGSQDVVLDDDVVKKISPTFQRLRLDFDWKTCGHKQSEECRCPIPREARKASAFLQKRRNNSCYQFFQANGTAFVNVELVKMLLLYGEMDTIFRICAHPDVDLHNWWDAAECQDLPRNAGWNEVSNMALRAYLCLNVLHCFPETWDLASGKTDETDYRQTRLYQYMLRTCTLSGMTSEVSTHPHRQFFGIERGQFKLYPSLRDGRRWAYLVHIGRRAYDYPYGLMPIEELLVCEQQDSLYGSGYRPQVSEIAHVRGILCSRGLPVELAMEIMDMAGYVPLRRLKVPNDPLHLDNKDELAEYLKYCWLLMIRSDMMAKALGMEIPWKTMVSECLIDLLGCINCSRGKWFEDIYTDDSYDNVRFL